MREKLLDLMKSEGLKPSQLAELLEINPAGISHLMAGRNKPSFELLQKILRRFPRINPDWLLLDSAQMYRDNLSDTAVADDASSAPELNDPSNLFAQVQPPAGSLGIEAAAKPSENRTNPTAPDASPQYPAHDGLDGLQVDRVVVFYSDHSFESYTPKR